MTARLIDGKAVAARVRQGIADEVASLKAKHGLVPGLATVLVGENPASQFYVRSKGRACEKAGIYSTKPTLPADATQEQVEAVVNELNEDPDIDGILVQLPLPDHMDEEAVLAKIGLHKDVDGFHPVNIGRLVMKGRQPMFKPCTPAGCIVLIDEAGAEISGADAVVVGRSNIVGVPVAGLLRERNATVTICHSRTKDLAGRCRSADILVAAIGRPEMIKGDWIKPGATVIDVGINRVDDASRERGYRLCGDVAFDEAVEVAGAITPVPGGVGPMTIAMLLQNTLTAFHYRLQRLGLE